MDKKVLYALVAYWEKPKLRIVADHPVDVAAVYQGLALSALESINSHNEDEKVSLNQGRYTVHVLSGELRYACLTSIAETESSAPQLASASYTFLERLRSVYRELPILADLSRDLTNLSIIDLSAPLKKIVEEYNHDGSDILPRLEGELAEVRQALLDGVQKLVDRGQRLDDLIRKTQTLQIMVRRDFRGASQAARRRKIALLLTSIIGVTLLSSSILVEVSKYHSQEQKRNVGQLIIQLSSISNLSIQMASVIALKNDQCKFENEISNREQEAEFARRILFVAARKIQAWFRGILTRNHVRSLHERVTIIQRHWRGYRGRVYAEFYLVESVVTSWKQYYNAMAGRIQAVWRGYWVRKNVMDIGKLREWLDYVYKKNNETVKQMKKFRETELENARNVTEYESMLWILYILFKLHHLLGTKHKPGVLSRIDENKCISVEKMMQCFKYSLYNKKRREDNCDCQESIDPPLILKGTHLERCEKEIREFQKKLRAGKIPIYRSQSYEENERTLRNLRKFNDKMPNDEIRKKPERKTRCPLNDRVRLLMGKYEYTSKGQFPPIRPPRDKRKELGGDFKLIIKPNEIYETICKMECGFDRLRIKCPIHHEETSLWNM